MKTDRFKIFLLFPFLGLFAAFALDKLPFIGEFPNYFIKSASHINYEHKEEMLYELAAYLKKPDRKKVFVVFGNSRTMPFERSYIKKHHPDWILFNFSVPGGTSDYFAYLMGRFEELNIHPDHLFFTVTPQGFNDTARVQMDEVMLSGLPFLFILENLTHFRLDDLTNYVAKKLFWSYRDKPVPSTILQRMRNDSAQMKALKQFVASAKHEMLINRGSVPTSSHKPAENGALLAKHALSIWQSFLYPFTYSANQHYFTEIAMQKAMAMQIPFTLLWAKVSPPLRRLKNEEPAETVRSGTPRTIVQIWKPQMESLAKKYGADLLDMNYGETIACDLFFDASHMAGQCFGEFTDYLIDSISPGR